MGITNFLPDLIASQGRLIDLRDFGERRIAIDVSTWIHNATQKHGQMLGDERHLSNFGRAGLIFQEGVTEEEFLANEALEKEKIVTEFVAKCASELIDRLRRFQQATKSNILVVLDGKTPPIKKETTSERRSVRAANEQERDRPVDLAEGASSPAIKRRVNANKYAGAGKHYSTVVDAIIKGMRENEIPFLVSPYESDAQLAFLQNKGLVDLVVTEDSDLVAYGLETPVLYKLQPADDGTMTQGYLIRRQDLGALVPHKAQGKFNLLDFSPSLLSALFVATGCDYCGNLKGVGVGKACARVREAFLDEYSNTDTPPLESLLRKLRDSSFDSQITDEAMDTYHTEFAQALFMFRHAIVYDPLHCRCRPLVPLSQPDAEFLSFPPYRQIFHSADRRAQIVGTVLGDPVVETYMAEGWICANRRRVRPHADAPAAVQTAWNAYLTKTRTRVPQSGIVYGTPTNSGTTATNAPAVGS